MRARYLSVVLGLLLLAAPVAAQNPTNIFVNGTAPTVNSGNKDNGTIRVVVATDQPSNSNAWLVSGIVSVSNTAVGTAIAVRCVDTSGSVFEACGGSGGGGGGTSSSFGAAIPATGTATGYSDGTNMQLPRVFDTDSGAGSQYVPGVSLRKTASGGSVEAGTSSDPLRVDPTGTTPQPVTDNGSSLTVDAPVGTPVFTRLSDGSAALGTGNGTAASALRVTLPTDGTGVVGLNAGTNLIGQVGRKNTFDSAVTMTTTNFTSLGSGSGWGGGSITTSGCYDIRFRVLTKGSSASNTAYVDFYLATAIAGETTFDDAASSSEGAFTAGNRKNSRFVSSVLMNGTSAVQGSFSALDAFPTLPGVIVPIALNNSGAGLSTTGSDHVIKYECVR